MRHTRPPEIRAAVATALFLSAMTTYPSYGESVGGAVLDEAAVARGFSTVEATCFGCHSPDASPAQRIAPPMAAIKRHYLDDYPAFEDFRAAMVAFVDNPSRENVRMPGAVERFGLMPKFSFEESMIADVAYYLYHTPLEEPSWFAAHYAAQQQRYANAARAQLNTPDDYRRYGQQLAMQTKTELGSNMKASLKEKGTDATIDFCKTRAAPIAREMSEKLDAQISRVSDRPRNPANAANDRERAVMQQFADAIARGEKPGAVVHDDGDRMIGYYPVVTNGMCLQCHGQPGTDIRPSTMAILREEYPDDRATGYGPDELRGIFVVSMDKTGAEE
jgi:cytochrome c553